MRHAKVACAAVAATLMAACMAASNSDSGSGPRSNQEGKADGGDRSSPNAGAADPGPLASGIIIVHAAAFPSFRLCFSNYPDLPPMPDSKVMPQANVVGVEMGSLVRLDPLKAPGKVYVISEAEVRSTPGTANEVTCGERLGSKRTDKTLVNGNDYTKAVEEFTEPLGENKVSVLAITGCGSLSNVSNLDDPPRDPAVWASICQAGGATWEQGFGTLHANVFDLTTTPAGATDKSLPVQLFQLSAQLAQTGLLQVTFGDLKSDAGGQPVPSSAVFHPGSQTALALNQSNDAVYGSFGFRIRAGSVAIDQTLASVQELSAPNELPTTYYRVASNYALLLLGDPTHTPAASNYNPRRAVHMLAVPVLDPEKADAGAADAGGGG